MIDMDDLDQDGVSLWAIMGVIMFSTLFSLGGGNGQVAVIQDQWVSRGLLEPTLFAWAFAIGNFVPGPKVSFIAGIGYYMGGIPGALAALVGIVVPTSIGASLASHYYLKFNRVIQHMSLSAGFVIAGMMTTAGIALGMTVDQINVFEVMVIVIAALMFFWLGLDAIIIVASAAALGVVVWWLGL
jgi:chromate transporter